MGILRATDKIGALSHSAGNILMAASIANPAYLTIGGRQFKITSQLSVALPSMTANSRYQVFAVQTAGVPALAISSNENSVGPLGYTGWKLVGSLYASGAGAFGAFVSITGAPSSDWINSGATNITAVSVAPTKSNNIVADYMNFRVNGNMADIVMYYEQSSTTGTAAGTGDYLFNLPANLVIDTTIARASTSFSVAGAIDAPAAFIGSFKCAEPASNNIVGWCEVYNTTSVRAIGGTGVNFGRNAMGPTIFSLTVSATKNIWLSFSVPIVGWTNVPIEAR